MKQAEMEIKKGQNMVEHEAEIFSRPARTWFQSEKEKTAAKGEPYPGTQANRSEAGKATYVSSFPNGKPDEKEKSKKDQPKRGKYDGLSRKAKRRKMANEADAEDDSARISAAAIRKAKKSALPTKISEPMAKPITAKSRGKPAKAKPASGGKKRGSAFDDDRGQRAKVSSSEGMRAKRVKVNLSKGPKTKGRTKK